MPQNVDLQVLAGDYVKTALIAEWKVKVGDAVKKDDVLLTCETAKVTVDILSPCDGIVEKILFPAGEEVDISETVAVISDGNATGNGVKPTAKAMAAAEENAAAKAPAEKPHTERVFITPVARKIAKELGVDLEELKAELGKNKISRADVETYVEKHKNTPSTPATAAPDTNAEAKTILMKGRRRAIAQKMTSSATTKPHVTLMIDADMEEILRVKKLLADKYPDSHVTVTGLLAVAVCRALKDHPAVNAMRNGDTIVEYPDIRLGIAVDMPEGLIVPVVNGCEKMSGLDLCLAINETVKGCREGSLPPSAYAGSTFSITNLGNAGMRYFTPIINAPEAAILGVGAMFKELELENGQITERRKIGLSLSFDHSVLDGAPAGNFLKTLQEYIEQPALMSF